MLLQYLRDRLPRAAALAAFALVFLCVYALYRLPIEAFLYALALCALAGAAIAAADYRRYASARRALRAALHSIDLSLDALPQPRNGIEADYQRLIRAQFDALAAQSRRSAREHAALTEYYTLWTHQVKTPIAAMRLILQGGACDVRLLRQELLHIERYVGMALCYARLDGDGSDLVIRSVPLDGVVRQALRSCAPLFIYKKLAVELSPIAAVVLTDEKWLCFAIEQILSNAIKYTAKGSVCIFTEGEAALVIRDTGAGIPPEDLPRVFERSFTGFNGRADKRATGIGLYLTKRVLNRLGHGISIASTPGEGTTVRIDLARQAPDLRD